MLNMFRMLIHPSSGACDLFIELFHGLYFSGSKCVGITLWFGWGGMVWGGEGGEEEDDNDEDYYYDYDDPPSE